MAVKILNGIDVDGSMNIVASDVPNLDASKITSGTLSADRIPNLSGVYQPAGDYLTLETAETTFQPLGNYLTSIPAEYLTQTEGDARYLKLSGGTISGNLEVGATNKTSDTVVRSLADQNYKAGFEAYGNGQGTGYFYAGQSNSYGGGFSYNGDGSPAFINNEDSDHITFFRRAAGVNSEVFHYSYNSNDVYFNGAITVSGGNSNQWNTAYGWGNHASVGYLTSLPSHNHDTLYDALGSADAVNVRIDEEVFPALNDLGNAIPTNNNQLTNGAGYITSADGGNAATLEGRKADDFLKANDTPLSNTDLDTLYDDDSTLYYSNSEYNTNTNIPFNNYFTLLNIRNPYGDNTGDAASSLDRGNQLWFGDTPNKFYVRYFQGTSTGWHPWERVWTDHSFSDTNVSNWNTAYGWGNHASAGYLKSIPASYATDAEVSSAVGAIESSINERIDTEVFDAIATVDGNIPTNNNQLTNGAGYITSYTETDTLDSVVSRNGSTGNQVNLSSSANRFNGHHYFDQYDSSGNHYPHYVSGSGGAVVNTRVYRNATQWRLFVLNGKNGSISWDGNELATQSYVTTQINNVIDSAPGALNTLNELAAALGDDANFSTTITNQIAAVDERINTEVFDAIATVDGNIPTNNNQLTNGAGYITAVPSSFSTNSITIGSGVTLRESTDRADLLSINSGTGGWGGLQITNNNGDGIWSFMVDGSAAGIYDDQNGDWAIYCVENSYVELRHNGSGKLATNSGGVTVTGTVTATGGNSTNWNTAYGWGNHAGLYDTTGSASNAEGNAIAHADTRIETEVFPAIPTNNNQLTNGAGYITDGNTNWNNTYGFIARGDTQEPGGWTSATKFKSSGPIADSDSGSHSLQVISDNGNDAFMSFHVSGDYAVFFGLDGGTNRLHTGGWSAGANQYMLWDSRDFSSTNISNWNTVYGWGNHASAGYLKSIPSTYVQQTQDIVSGNIHPVGDREQLLGLDSNRWQVVFCEILDSAGQHEKNLQNPEGEKSVGEYETGTVLVWKDGKNIPCTEPADHMRMGIAVQGVASPLIQGAEPVLVTGTVNEGDYLVTSSVEGHAKAISPQFMRQHGLYDCVLGKALENGEGESYLLKTWINI